MKRYRLVEADENSYKVVYTTSKVVKANSPSQAVTEIKKEYEDATNVHVDTSYKPEENEGENMGESLKESYKGNYVNHVKYDDPKKQEYADLVNDIIADAIDNLWLVANSKISDLPDPGNNVSYDMAIKENYAIDNLVKVLTDNYFLAAEIYKNYKNESLKEDLDQEELHDFGYTAYITDAINDEYQTIDKYNKALIAFKDGNQDSAVDVIDDIVKEEYTHIGQLQELLKLYSDPSEKIKSGEKEAVGQIEEGEDTAGGLDSFLDKNNLELVKGPDVVVEEDTKKFDDDFGAYSGFDFMF